MSRWIVMGVILVSAHSSFSKPQEEITPQDICKSIDSNKYQAQCESIIFKASFDSKVLQVCASQKSDYNKKSCLHAVKNKEYTEANVSDCLKTRKVGVLKCLQLNGVEKKQVEPAKAEATIEK